MSHSSRAETSQAETSRAQTSEANAPNTEIRESRDTSDAIRIGRDNRAEQTVGGHKHRHGRPSSWVLVGVITAAFCAGGAALIAGPLWGLFWACAAIVVLSLPVGKIIGIMDDTVMVQEYQDDDPPAADRGSVADPGVRMD